MSRCEPHALFSCDRVGFVLSDNFAKSALHVMIVLAPVRRLFPKRTAHTAAHCSTLYAHTTLQTRAAPLHTVYQFSVSAPRTLKSRHAAHTAHTDSDTRLSQPSSKPDPMGTHSTHIHAPHTPPSPTKENPRFVAALSPHPLHTERPASRALVTRHSDCIVCSQASWPAHHNDLAGSHRRHGMASLSSRGGFLRLVGR